MPRPHHTGSATCRTWWWTAWCSSATGSPSSGTRRRGSSHTHRSGSMQTRGEIQFRICPRTCPKLRNKSQLALVLKLSQFCTQFYTQNSESLLYCTPDPQHLQHQVEELIRDGSVEKDELAHQRATVALLLRLSQGRQLQVQVLGARLFGENRGE